MPRRFSVRSVLVAITLAGVALGLARVAPASCAALAEIMRIAIAAMLAAGAATGAGHARGRYAGGLAAVGLGAVPDASSLAALDVVLPVKLLVGPWAVAAGAAADAALGALFASAFCRWTARS
ncbi:MAG: hypothetical protein ACRCT8_06660 [Lacipirellulaceae bacterium]